jgi:hypothetical protein
MFQHRGQDKGLLTSEQMDVVCSNYTLIEWMILTRPLLNRHLDVTDSKQTNGKEEIWPVAQITWGLLEPGSPQFFYSVAADLRRL